MDIAVENIVAAGVTLFAFLLTVISVAAFRRTGDRGLLLLAAAFGIFFGKGITITLFLFFRTPSLATLFLASGVFDLAVLSLFYVTTLRR